MRYTLPVININGSDKDSLVEQYHAVYNGLGEAIVAIRRAWPHGRDYQQVSPLGDLQRAEDQFRADIIALQRIQDHYAQLINHCLGYPAITVKHEVPADASY